jgi:hypothetical protein
LPKLGDDVIAKNNVQGGGGDGDGEENDARWRDL